MIHIGIDPGASGAIAWIKEELVAAYPLKGATDTDIVDLLSELRRMRAQYSACHAILEEVHAMPKQGVSSTFKFGVSYGGLRMALAAAKIPFDYVTPAVWQAAMRCRTKGDKNVTRARAQELFPQLKVTHAIADALLIAEYGRRLGR